MFACHKNWSNICSRFVGLFLVDAMTWCSLHVKLSTSWECNALMAGIKYVVVVVGLCLQPRPAMVTIQTNSPSTLRQQAMAIPTCGQMEQIVGSTSTLSAKATVATARDPSESKLWTAVLMVVLEDGLLISLQKRLVPLPIRMLVSSPSNILLPERGSCQPKTGAMQL